MTSPESALPVAQEKSDFEIHHAEEHPEFGLRDAPLETKYADLSRPQIFRQFWKAILFCVIACWAGLNDGFQGQLPGNILPLQAFVKTMADTTINGQPAISGLTVSFLGGFPAMAQIFGQFSGGFISNTIGRKGSMMLFSALFLTGSILSITAQNWKWFMGAGMVTKLGLGIAQTTLIVYLAEIAPFQLRGTSMAAYQLFLAGGQLLGAVATQIQVSVNLEVWRPLIASEFVITGLFVLMIPFVPESHIYHIRKDNEEQAKKSMLKLYGTAPNYDVDHEYMVIKQAIEAERAITQSGGKSSFFEIFKGSNLRRTIAGVIGACSQPLAGAPLLFSYSTYYFSIVGVKDPFLVTVIVDIVLLATIAISMALCETVGRRSMMLSGCCFMFAFTIALGITGSWSNEAAGKAALGLLILWTVAYSWSAAPIGFISAGETSTPRLRAQTSALAFACQSSCFFVFYWTVPIMISPDQGNLGVRASFVFAALIVPVGLIVYFFYPETTGRTYVELDELYAMGIPARKFKSTTTSTEARGLKNEAIITHGH
ncbi:hypothetical protein I302_100987 [Kwoniella bestiolae CBS 10118]|uniref:Major facilitator superfamily (MFS) profile domain-containing protein n=1 Tax=Kwoniella bestiolae CBS 10118 TaxID=1296100 RepID=A0A1B9G6L4_9TREE|nr:hypothetical protein I302_04364 [Kwoniella bestiolae CBS 10118]OCF26677.1 hypothetical protein I302_04364 [Kwoniella bestiolae CBS 10118]